MSVPYDIAAVWERTIRSTKQLEAPEAQITAQICIAGIGSVSSQKLLVADFLTVAFRTFRLRGRQHDCISCGGNAQINAKNLASYDYRNFTGQDYHDRYVQFLAAKVVTFGLSHWIATVEEKDKFPFRSTIGDASALGQSRISAETFMSMEEHPPILDVRPADQYNALHISGITLPTSLPSWTFNFCTPH